MPFLVFGVLVSGLIAAFVPAAVLRRLLPRRLVAAVPVAGMAGMMLPGCECASVPVSRRLMQQGVPPAAALTFLLAAPAVNPVVLVSTAVAFPGEPRMGGGPVPRFTGHRGGGGVAVGAFRTLGVDRRAGTAPNGAGPGPQRFRCVHRDRPARPGLLRRVSRARRTHRRCAERAGTCVLDGPAQDRLERDLSALCQAVAAAAPAEPYGF
jgi:hypothetical protein